MLSRVLFSHDHSHLMREIAFIHRGVDDLNRGTHNLSLRGDTTSYHVNSSMLKSGTRETTEAMSE